MLGNGDLHPPERRAIEGRVSPAIVLSVAGFDPSSGAGVTADLQTFAAHGLFGTSAITTTTVQSSRGVFEVQSAEAGLLRRTLERLHEDLPPAGIKVGALGSAEIASELATWLRELPGKRPLVVLDPVLRSSSGKELLSARGVEVLARELLPLVDWITPNWPELAALSGQKVFDPQTAVEAMATLDERWPHLNMVATAGDAPAPTDLLRLAGGAVQEFIGTRIKTRSTHGTGCAFSSALLSRLVQGQAPAEAVAAAKRFVEGALLHAPSLGSGRGPMDLLWPLRVWRAEGEGVPPGLLG